MKIKVSFYVIVAKFYRKLIIRLMIFSLKYDIRYDIVSTPNSRIFSSFDWICVYVSD